MHASHRLRTVLRSSTAGLVLLALAVRALVAARTAVPDHDAGAYLWMAERVAAGDLRALFDTTVFHPLHPLLVGAALAVVDADAFRVAQAVGCGCGALATWPLIALTRRELGRGRGTAALAGLLYAVGLWFSRVPADALSEGVFLLLVPCTLLAAPRRPLLAGALAGLAYAARPEGAALALVLAPWCASRRPRTVVALAAGFVLGGAWCPIGWALWGPGWTPTPKLAFVLADGVARPDASLLHYPVHALRAIGTAFEAIGFLVLPLAGLGVVLASRRRIAPTDGPTLGLVVLAPLVVQLAVIPLLRSHVRFVVGYGILALPFAALGLRTLLGRGASSRPLVAIAAVVLVLAPDLARLPHARRVDRLVLVELGAWLRPRLDGVHGSALVSDVHRLPYFAGRPPLTPRRLTTADLETRLSQDDARWLVARERVAAPLLDGLRATGWQPVTLPTALATSVRARRLVVWQR